MKFSLKYNIEFEIAINKLNKWTSKIYLLAEGNFYYFMFWLWAKMGRIFIANNSNFENV